MKPRKVYLQLAAVVLSTLTIFPSSADATSNYTYKPGEYVTIVDGRSPDGQYLIAAHGEGAHGYEHFHLYLMNAKTGKPIGPAGANQRDPGYWCHCLLRTLVRRFPPGLDYLPG